MNAFPKIDMMEATRLTREGRLEEAMAVLCGALPALTAPVQPRGRCIGEARRAHALHSRHGAAVDREPGALGRRRSSVQTQSAGRPGGHEPAADA